MIGVLPDQRAEILFGPLMGFQSQDPDLGSSPMKDFVNPFDPFDLITVTDSLLEPYASNCDCQIVGQHFIEV
jgi:hypothetical protein